MLGHSTSPLTIKTTTECKEKKKKPSFTLFPRSFIDASHHEFYPITDFLK